MAATTTSVVTHGVNNFYVTTMLERAEQALLHELFGQQRPIPKNNTGTIKFRRYNALNQNTTPLVEGETPAGTALSITDITASIDYYGDFITLTDVLMMETLDPLMVEGAEVLGQQMGESMDSIVRDDLHAGTNVTYAGSGNTQTSEVAAGDVPATADLDAIILALKNANAVKITQFVRPDAGYGTTSVRPGYVGIFHTNSMAKIKALTGFEHVEDYQNMATPLPAEIGRYEDIRFCETTNGKVFSEAGTGSIDVYSGVIFGQNAYGVTQLSGLNSELIVKQLGSSGTADPLNQRATMGWKTSRVAKILNESWIYRYEHAIA